MGGGGGAGGGGGGGGAPTLNMGIKGMTGTAPLVNTITGLTMDRSRISTEDGNAQLDIASGTKMVDSNGKTLTFLTATPVTSQQGPPAGGAIVLSYEMGPTGAKFEPPFKLTMTFDPATLPAGAQASKLYVGFKEEKGWTRLDTTLNAASNSLSAQVAHFTEFAILADNVTPPTPPPAPVPVPPPTRHPTHTVPAPSGARW